MASLTRKFLASVGCEEDKIDLILEKYTEVLTEIKDERDKYKADAEKLPEVQKQLDELKEKVANDDGEARIAEANKKYEALEKQFNDFKADITAKQTKATKESAKKAMLKDIGVADKFIDLIMKASADDIDSYEFEEDGKTVKDAEKKKEAYKNSYADFIEKKGIVGAPQNTPPASNGGSTATSRAAELFKQHTENMYGTKSKED